MESEVTLEDLADDIASWPDDRRRDPRAVFDAFLAFARRPVSCSDGRILGDQISLEVSVWTAEDAAFHVGDQPDPSVSVSLTRDLPVHDHDGDYVGRWASGVALTFAPETALPGGLVITAELDLDLSEFSERPAEPISVDEFEQAVRAKLPELFTLQALDLVVDELQEVG